MTDSGRLARVVTWNVHGCVGRDGRFDPERTSAALRPLAADIVALQEVDARHGLDTFDFFRKSLGRHAAEARSITTPDGDYGQMVISRWPMRNTRVHDLSYPGREARRAIEVEVVLPGGTLHLIATHLGLNGRERHQQLQRLKTIVESVRHPFTVLMGDLNDWGRRGTAHRAFGGLFGKWTGHRTFPSRLPLLPLDRLWCRPGAMLHRSWTLKSARQLSDHLPIVADLVDPQARPQPLSH